MRVRAADGTGNRKADRGTAPADASSSPLAFFCTRLRRLQQSTGITQTSLAVAAHLGTSQMSDILNGRVKRLPSWEVTDAVVATCLAHAQKMGRPVPPDLRDRADWRRRYGDVEQDLGTQLRPRRPVAAGWPLAEVTDPFDFDLEVHRAFVPDGLQSSLPALTAYVLREHDRKLADVMQAAAGGFSRIAGLVGDSSTGKTRACWEALGLLRERPEQWRLWHPIDPTRPEAALDELSSIGPRTVIWLNEAQFYLDAPGGLGERVAAGLRELLRDPARAPVLVLATLWPQFWDSLTARPAAGADPHAQARELLAGRFISVPSAFTADELRQLRAADDPRLARAAEAAEDGRVIQFLAGAPELMARYSNAPPSAAALVNAAMDARRMGMGIPLPATFLQEASPGYLTDTDWDGLGENWLEEALAYTAAQCKGVRGPLSRIRPRLGGYAAPGTRTVYRLADHLEQFGRRARRPCIPPDEFWRAAAHSADPGDLPALARAAEDRGLLRDAARLRKHAAAQGDASEAATLVRNWKSLHGPSTDPRPARWAAAHADVDNLSAVAGLLDVLQEAGAHDQADTLATRAANHADLRDPSAVARLLNALRRAGAQNQADTMVARAFGHADLGNLTAVAGLMNALREAGAQEQADMLASRAAADADLHDLSAVAELLSALREAGAHDQADTLATRAVRHADLDNLSAVARLLDVLRRSEAWKQADALAVRAAAHADINVPSVVARLLDVLRRAGTREHAALLARDPAAHVELSDPSAVARFLDALRRARAQEQADTLLARDPAEHVDLDNLSAVARLLDVLREAGAHDQADTLATRATNHADLRDPSAVARLLDALRDAGAHKQADTLATRAANHADLHDLSAVARLLDALRRSGAQEQANALAARAAEHADLHDLSVVARLLDALQDARAQEQADTLAARAAEHADLDSPFAVAGLLDALREAGAHKQADTLLARNPAEHADLDSPFAVAGLLDALRDAGAHKQADTLAARAAEHADLDDWLAAAHLLDSMREAGVQRQARTMINRLPSEAQFSLFRKQADNQTRYRFGRELNGNPALPWNWDDLA